VATIVRRARSRSFRGRSGRRRKLVWARSANTPAGTSIGAGVVIGTDLLADYVTQSGGDSLNGATLMAIRGRLWASAVQQAGVSIGITWGIRLDEASQVSLPAAQLLSTRAPGSSDRYGDWLARDYFWMPTTAGGINTFANGAVEYPALNIRSRRRIDELNATIALYVENLAGGATAAYAFDLDLLLALP